MLAACILMTALLGLSTATGQSRHKPMDHTRHFVTFGSSTTQTGFNSSLTWPSAGNVLGNPALPGWTTSGGLNWVSFDVTEFNSSLVLSYNLAVGGATTDSGLIPPYSPTVKSFVDQVDDFEKHLATKPTPWNSRNLLVGIWIANNDVGNTWNDSDLPTFYEKVAQKYFEQVRRLYKLGARNIVVLACAPQQETPLMKGNGSDLRKIATAVKLYNGIMAKHLKAFQKSHRQAKTWLVSPSKAYYEALNNPKKYGAPDSTCENDDGVSCLWWNNYHPALPFIDFWLRRLLQWSALPGSILFRRASTRELRICCALSRLRQ